MELLQIDLELSGGATNEVEMRFATLTYHFANLGAAGSAICARITALSHFAHGRGAIVDLLIDFEILEIHLNFLEIRWHSENWQRFHEIQAQFR